MREEMEIRPKPVVRTGGQPVLWGIKCNLGVDKISTSSTLRAPTEGDRCTSLSTGCQPHRRSRFGFIVRGLRATDRAVEPETSLWSRRRHRPRIATLSVRGSSPKAAPGAQDGIREATAACLTRSASVGGHTLFRRNAGVTLSESGLPDPVLGKLFAFNLG